MRINKCVSQGGQNSTKRVYFSFILLTGTILTAYQFLGPKYVIRINHQLSPEGQSTVGEPQQL